MIKLNLDTWTPIPGWRMTLHAGHGCTGQALTEQATDRDGITDFIDLAPGPYSVAEQPHDAYEPFTQPCQNVTLADPDPPTAAHALEYPPAGDDTFPSGAGLLVQIAGQAPTLLTVNGPTVVRRGEPYDNDGDGLQTIDTEILAMNLTGMTSLGPVGVRESPTRASHGKIQQQTPGADYPADSFFDVFVELDTGMGPLHHQEPVRMEAIIHDLPPILALYRTPQLLEVPIRNQQNQVVGYLRRVIHVPLPPKEIILIFVNRPKQPPPPVLTGISSSFWQDPASGQIHLTIHALRDEVSGIIHDFEIYWHLQNPPWQGAQPGDPSTWPPGWQPEPITDNQGQIIGIRWVTAENPLQKCQPIQAPILPMPADIGNFITIYLTDQDHNVIGQIAGQRVPPPGNGAARSSSWVLASCPPL